MQAQSNTRRRNKPPARLFLLQQEIIVNLHHRNHFRIFMRDLFLSEFRRYCTHVFSDLRLTFVSSFEPVHTAITIPNISALPYS